MPRPVKHLVACRPTSRSIPRFQTTTYVGRPPNSSQFISTPAPPRTQRPRLHSRTKTQARLSSAFLPSSTLSIAKMSTMPATHGHSVACCNVPPVVATGYSAKGSYDEVDGLKTYATGPDDATKGVVVIYDIFGYFDQTIQGADILATSDDHHKYKVVIPDWFEGSPCPIEWYPPNTPEKQKNLGAFFGKNPPPGVAGKLPGFVKALEAKFPSVKEGWAVLGFCWGGKVVSLVTSGDANPFKVGAECHPAMVEPKEAESIKVPLIMLASGEEPEDKVKEFGEKLKVPKHVETFKDQVHGWMAARSDLSNDHVKEEYVRGYKTVLDFFAKNWS